MRTTSIAPLALALALSVAGTACKKTSAAADDGGGAPATQSGSGIPALNGFEGELDVLAKGETAGKSGAPQSLTVFVKGDKLRMDIPEGMAASPGPGGPTKGWLLFDAPAKKLTMVNDPQKQAVVIDLNQKDALKATPLSRTHPGGPPSSPPKVTKTGKKDTVAGYSCEIWEIIDDKNEKAELCVASQGASWFHLPTIGIPTENAWIGELVDGAHMPLRFIDYAADGKEKGRVELTKIDKKTLPASEFEVPAGYRVIDLGQMFKSGAPGLPGLPGAPPVIPIPPHPPR